MGLQVVGAQAHALRAEEAHGAKITFLEAVHPHHLTLGGVECIPVPGHVHLQYFCRAEQSVRMFRKSENTGTTIGGAVGAHTFKNPDTVMKGVGQDVHFGLLPGNKLPIQPNAATEFRQIHTISSPSRRRR